MKIITAKQTQALDAATIKNEPISSLQLMERASRVFTEWFLQKFDNVDQPVAVFCGPGNNGGDGLVVARLLHYSFYELSIYLCKITERSSDDNLSNLNELPKHSNLVPVLINSGDQLPEISPKTIIIDAIFGSGLNRPVEAYWSDLIKHINVLPNTKVAIDIPSGLFADKHTTSDSIQADYTFSFQLPKLAFCFPENHHRIGQWDFGDIGLDQNHLADLPTIFNYVDDTFVKNKLKPRGKFDHKGTYGHALLIMGSKGKVGAALLAGKACLRTGVGLLSIHAPACAYNILQIACPEAMVSLDSNTDVISSIPSLENYKAIGIGCGLGIDALSAKALEELFEASTLPLVLDADALNLISQNKSLLKKIPKDSILTPHPKEFERLFGKTENDFHRNEIQRNKANELACYIVLKGAHTCIASPDGSCYFNSTGNPGMATGGSGDVLTGMITSLLAQGYASMDAAIIGVYLHGLAGDLAAEDLGMEAMIAGDIVDSIGRAFKKLNTTF